MHTLCSDKRSYIHSSDQKAGGGGGKAGTEWHSPAEFVGPESLLLRPYSRKPINSRRPICSSKDAHSMKMDGKWIT